MTLGDRVVVMRNGAIQQSGSPQTVYDRPTNRFVAEFIGMPPMNFLEGRVIAREGAVAFDDGAVPMPLPARMAQRLAGFAGREMVLGIRPDAFCANGAGPADGSERT